MAEQNIYIVKAGDTLSEIAQKFGIGSASGLGGNDWMAGAKWLGKKNKIEDIDYIVVGQKIKLFGIDAEIAEKPLYVTIKSFGLQARSQRGMYVSWHWSKKSETEEFEVTWQYYADKQWCNGTNTTVTAGENYLMHSIYTAPDNATAVRVGILPISKKKSSNGTAVYWTAKVTWAGVYSFSDNPPETPPTPSLDDSELKNLKLTASLSNLDAEWEKQGVKIEFQLVRNNSTVVKTVTSSIKTGYTSASWQSPNITAGNEYKVRCRAIKEVDDDLYSPWSAYSNNVSTKPGGVPEITKCQASKASDGSNDVCVYLEWSAINTADTYTIQYATDESDFEYNAAQEYPGIESTKYKTTALTQGRTYYFRVRGENSNGETDWSEKVSVVVGETPSAPTTWSSTSSVIAGNPVTLYWMHNSKDNSTETWAQIKIKIGGVENIIDKLNKQDDDDYAASYYILDSNGTDDGSVIYWQVRTAGIATLGYGPWSEERAINVYANPTLDLNLLNSGYHPINHDDPITSFPFHIRGLTGPESAHPIGYHISIVSNETYETLDYNGTVKVVSTGEEVYSKFFDIAQSTLYAEISAKDIDLENGVTYTMTVTATMDSGLDAETVRVFKVEWTDEERWPGAEVGIDREALVAYIRPYCEAKKTRYALAIRNIDAYGRVSYSISGTIDVVPPEDESLISSTSYTADLGGRVYSFTDTVSGTETAFCVVSEVKESTDVLLSVYRREFDGTYTELATGIDPAMNTHVTDPHPALDYARYRIVATQKGTGAITYLDIPMHEVGEKAVIIQWDEEWTSFDAPEDAKLADNPWHGSMLRLPYNIDVSDSYGSDNSLVKYIGRKYPVSYYGTQLESSSTWNVEIPKTDKETLYAIRRLAVWTGDVYVREPSGSGYWANISVSYSQKHRELTIPVTLNIKRVEGGA